jgi:Zn finger protein HypA/HybF involved in hydrogenase expression
MGQRAELEDRYTVECFHCGFEIVDPSKTVAQKYIRYQDCPHCHQSHPDDEEE